LLHRSVGTSTSAFSQRSGHYGIYAPFVTALYYVTSIHDIQRFSVNVNAGLCSRLCLNLFNYFETAVSQLLVAGLTAASFKSLILSMQSVSFSTGSKASLVLTGSGMLNIVGW
jgi:hypothetical protein